MSLLQLVGTFNLKSPWYGILEKRGNPLSKFQIWFLSPNISGKEVRTVVWICTHNY